MYVPISIYKKIIFYIYYYFKMTDITKYSDLQKLAFFLIKNHWIMVLCDKKTPSPYFSFSDWVNIWYVQRNYYKCWYDYSKTNRPSERHWTWFQTMTQVEATTENCKRTLLAHNNHLWGEHLCMSCWNVVEHKNDLIYANVQQFINYEKKFWENYGPITIEEITSFII